MLVYCEKHIKSSAPACRNARHVHTYACFFASPTHKENLSTRMDFSIWEGASATPRYYNFRKCNIFDTNCDLCVGKQALPPGSQSYSPAQ